MRRANIPGSYFGTDGAGFEHYWSSATRTMTVLNPESGEAREFEIPSELHDPDARPMVDWAIDTIEQHGEAWVDVRTGREHERKWLQGELPVGEFPGDDA